MKIIKKIAVLALMLAMTLTTVVPTTNIMAKTATKTTQAEAKYFELKINVKSFASTKLSWKKKKVDEFRIYEKTNSGKGKLLKTVSGKATSCTLKTKKNKNYEIYVEGITYNKHKKAVLKYWSDGSFLSGIAPIDFDEYDYAEAKTSDKYIKLSLCYGNSGITPDGYEIYKAYDIDEPFKKIATVKKANYKKNAKGCIEYTDKKVSFGETYYYKVRGYKKINGKKYYSKYSGVCKHKAVNNEGLFTVKKTVNGDTVTLAVTSAPGNASFQLGIENIMSLDNEDIYDDEELCTLKEFKFNDVCWTSPVKNYTVTVDAGNTMYFTFELPEKKDAKNLYKISDIFYNGFVAELIIDIDKAQAGIYLNSEFIH